MSRIPRRCPLPALYCALACMTAAGIAVAEDGAPASSPSAPAATPAAPPAPAAKRPQTAQAEAGEPRAHLGKAPKAADKPGEKSVDRVELDTTTVTGNRELPKVMYVVPWKKSDIGDLVGRPVNSLLDEVLAPVDRDVFRREVVYYRAVKPESAPNGGAAAGPQQQGEK